MCGIFGQLTSTQADIELVQRMARRIAHRGPDGYNVFCEGHFAFGAGRLAIIDLDAPAGALWNEDRSVGVVFNGEIYNFAILREELIKTGHHFVTHTDTEVLVHGYEEWGIENLLERLNGMFAFCIFDVHEDCLWLARDRLGEKPLYYTRHVTDEFLFASEIKALFESERLTANVNYDALPYYLTLGYVPAPQTMFAGIHKLGAGEFMRVTTSDITVQSYWVPQMDTTQVDYSYSDAVKQVRQRLEQAVESRMMSDVTVGALLSGGVDSSAVVALMNQMTNKPVNTFTVGFDFAGDEHGDSKFNVDLHHAEQAAAHLRTHHHAIIIQDDFIAELLPHLVHQMDEPVAQHSIMQTAYVTAIARHMDVPVLLSGDAGDELFLGYGHYVQDQKLAQVMRVPRFMRSGIAPLVKSIPRFAPYAEKLMADSPSKRYLEWMRFLRVAEADALLARPFADDALSDLLTPVLQTPNTDAFADRIAYTSLRLWIAEDSNMRMDKMSMLMSVESRAPLEDHHFVDFALSLPLDYKLRHGDVKRVFKDAVRDLLPETILNRPKWGFIPPTSDWLRHELRSLVDDYLSPDYVTHANLCNPTEVSRLVTEHMTKRGYHLKAVWALLVLHMWHAIYIDKSLVLSDKVTAQAVIAGSEIHSTNHS